MCTETAAAIQKKWLWRRYWWGACLLPFVLLVVHSICCICSLVKRSCLWFIFYQCTVCGLIFNKLPNHCVYGPSAQAATILASCLTHKETWPWNQIIRPWWMLHAAEILQNMPQEKTAMHRKLKFQIWAEPAQAEHKTTHETIYFLLRIAHLRFSVQCCLKSAQSISSW